MYYYLILELLKEGINDIQIMALKYATGLECNEHIVYTAISMTSKLDLAYFTLLRNSVNPIVIIGSCAEYGKTTSVYVKKKLLENEITNVVLYTMKQPTLAEGHTAVSLVRSTIYPGI